jgi:hypothetical protein
MPAGAWILVIPLAGLAFGMAMLLIVVAGIRRRTAQSACQVGASTMAVHLSKSGRSEASKFTRRSD